MAKFKKINFKSKSLWKKIGLGVLAGVVLIGAVFGVTALFRKAEEETQKEISPSYAIGGLTETGAYLETKESIYTKDAFGCIGLNTSLDFDSNVSYRIFFYNEKGSFLESTSKLTENYGIDTPVGATQCRIVITPNEDSKISWYEKSSYAKQLKIVVDKEQKYVAKLRTITFTSDDLSNINITDTWLFDSNAVYVIGRFSFNHYIHIYGTDITAHNVNGSLYSYKTGIFIGTPSSDNAPVIKRDFTSDEERIFVEDTVEDYYIVFSMKKLDGTEVDNTDLTTFCNGFYVTYMG